MPTMQDFDSVVEMYSGEIFAYLWRLLNRHEDAEDCLQEVFLRAFKAYDRLNQDANIRAWLYKIATNTSITFRKKRERVESLEFIVDYDLLSNERSPDDRMEWKERLENIMKAIHNLPDRQRSALIMRKYQELSYSEISEILGCSPEAARANVYQAVKKLRAWYTKRSNLVE